MAGCASVPLSSMIKLAAIGRDGIEQIDPSEIRVRVSVSPGFEIDVARTTLGFSITRDDGAVREEKLSLQLIERSAMTRSDGFMRRSAPLPTYILRLTPAEVKKFSEIRASALAKDRGARRTFSVSAPFSRTPLNPRSVKFWTDLKFSDESSWVVLLDGAEMYFKPKR